MTASTRQHETSAIEHGTLALYLLVILFGSLFIQSSAGLRQSLLFLIGIGLGISLLQAMFGFTGGWRQFIRNYDSKGIRAQILLIILTSIFFFPILGQVFSEQTPAGAIAPIGYSVLIGAFLFGIGMQLGGGCGSGTLFTAGQGQVDMLITMAFFIIGATMGSAHLAWWFELGDLGTYSLVKEVGWLPGLFMTIAALLLLYGLVRWIDKRKNQSILPVYQSTPVNKIIPTLIYGKWPIWWAVISLAVLNLLTLLVAGHPWSITYAFGLWGTKIWAAVGGDVSQWEYWLLGYPSQSLDRSVLLDNTSVMNFGLIIGAGLAANLGSRFAPAMTLTKNKLFAVIIGGLLLGYGARLAFGCNIGALLAGISSGSLHGWLWLVAAFIGNMVGTHLRVFIKLDKAF